MASSTLPKLTWAFKYTDNKLYIIINSCPMRKPSGEEYSHVTLIERGQTASQVKFSFHNSKTARSMSRTDFNGALDDFNKKFAVAATISNAAFIRLVEEETGVKQRKRQLLNNGSAHQTKKARLATEASSQDMPGSQTVSVMSPEFGDKFLGQFDLRLSMLECSPSNYIVRTIRDNWVKEIKERILKDPGRAPVILPATIDATQCQSKEDFNPQNLPTYTVFALGGNHLVTAMKEVLIDHPELAYLSNVRVDLYAALTDKEARTIANLHNARLRSLEMTFQDKVRQAKWLKDSGSEHLTTDTARMLSEVTLKEVPKESVTTIVSIANYPDEAYELADKIFDEYEHKYGVGKSVPVKLFKTLQGNIFTLDQKCKYLRLASDTSLIQAGVEAEKEKKRKMVQQTFVDQTTCTDWTEAKELYPAHTTEEMIDKLADFNTRREYVPRALLKHIETAKLDQPVPKDPKITLKCEIEGRPLEVGQFPQIDSLIGKTLKK